ncbi:MAG TPA: NAD(P)-dependent oxidoreductase [Caldilineaceae bacterium]|nr:NAD(P)-dependent oxidoreductase [Caldilineaceae bacterium]
MQSVLVTGMSGLIGGAVGRRLAGRYHPPALNRRDGPGVRPAPPDSAALAAIQPAFAGQEVVVHLSAVVNTNAPWSEVLQSNVVGAYNVFEAARQAGVRRVIFASSGTAIGGYAQQSPYNALLEGRYDEVPQPWPMLTHQTLPHPASLYGVSKVWGEQLARHFADTTPMSMICLRFGVVNRADRPTDIRHFPIWCSQRDAAQMVERCIQAPPALKYDLFYVTSNNQWGYRDLSHAREVLGYAPEDAAEAYR